MVNTKGEFMLTKTLTKSLVLVISMASVANAYLTPGHGGGGQQPPTPPHYCENPYGPCDQHGNPIGHNPPPHTGHPHEPGYPAHPGQPPLQPGYPPSHPGHPNYPHPSEPSYGNREVKQIYIGRSVRNERLSLSQLAGLDSRYRGWEVVSVRGQTQPNSPSTTIAQLVSDGRIVAEQRNPGYMLNLQPYSSVVLGSSNGLQLIISGSTYIDVIEVEIVNNGNGYNPNPGYGSDRVQINLNRQTFGNDRIDLTSYIDMYQHRGQRIDSIEIRARATYNVAVAEILINSFRQGAVQFNGNGYTESQTIYLNQSAIIGQGADNIVLQTRGNMTIESVVLHLN